MDNIHYISMLVTNTSGVLTRISGLFARRGYNIESLSVCATEDENVSRMTISIKGDERQIVQLKSQLEKQVEVICVMELKSDESVIRELLLVKIEVPASKRAQILEISSIFKAKTIDLTKEAMVLELTGSSSKIDAFIEVIRPYEIIELARSGASALNRGSRAIKDLA